MILLPQAVAHAGLTAYHDPGIDNPWGITAGPGGEQAMWFVNAGDYGAGDGSIGRITTEGVVSTYADPAIGEPLHITAGPSGENALWFTDRGTNAIDRITTDGAVTSYRDPCIDYPEGITVGPDGDIWFTNFASGYTSVNSSYTAGHSIGRITPAGEVTCFTDPHIFYPASIAVGPDGALWFTNFGYEPCEGPLGCGGRTIGRITTAGVVSTYEDPAIHDPSGIASGPDGAVWFTNAEANSSIGRITPEGVVTSFTDPAMSTYPGMAYGISAGLPGEQALWFTEYYKGTIGRITTAGEIERYTEASIERPRIITPGPDGAMWFTSAEGVGGGGGPGFAFGVQGNRRADAAGDVHWIGRITPNAFSKPAVTSLSPQTGPSAGGSAVTITGTHLTGATAVNFGATGATSFTVNSATSITATSPAGSGTVDVTVTTPEGTSSANPPGDSFAYEGAPTVTKLQPTKGPVEGGTTVTITGTHLTGATAVNFRATGATSFTVNSATSITATSPAGSGTVDVTVTTPEGTSSANPPGDSFAYQGAPLPSIKKLSPKKGPAAGGTAVAITGTDLGGATGVDFGGIAATYTVRSATELEAVAPPHTGGPVDVTVRSSEGSSALTKKDHFKYGNPTIDNISPVSGPKAGGTAATIRGSGFAAGTGITTILFGKTPAGSVTCSSTTECIAISPAASKAGTVDIVAVIAGKKSKRTAADRYGYE
jgi:streptogramin lyase